MFPLKDEVKIMQIHSCNGDGITLNFRKLRNQFANNVRNDENENEPRTHSVLERIAGFLSLFAKHSQKVFLLLQARLWRAKVNDELLMNSKKRRDTFGKKLII